MLDPDVAVLHPRSSDVTDVVLPVPVIGGKIWVLKGKGLFVLERGPCTFRTFACTHAGSGGAIFYDGVPNDNGFFPDENLPPNDLNFHSRNGREIYWANPVVMGSWMCDGGCYHGLTVRALGGTASVGAFGSIVWYPFRRAVTPSDVALKSLPATSAKES